MSNEASTHETSPEMPAAKSQRPPRPSTPPGSAASGERPAAFRASHADFLEDVRTGAVELLSEEWIHSQGPMEPGVRRIQFGAARTATSLIIQRWAEDHAGNWHKSEMVLPTSASRALGAILWR